MTKSRLEELKKLCEETPFTLKALSLYTALLESALPELIAEVERLSESLKFLEEGIHAFRDASKPKKVIE